MNESQFKMVKNYLESNNYLTSAQAFELFGITRLSAIIFRLRNKGYLITSTHRQSKNRYGNNCNYVEYRLIKEDFKNERYN
jgi:hypothetical protein